MNDEKIIDRVAYALWGQFGRPMIDGATGPLAKPDLAPFKTAARAAVAAMRNPTVFMAEAGEEQFSSDENEGGLRGGRQEALERAYTAMIDAALAER